MTLRAPLLHTLSRSAVLLTALAAVLLAAPDVRAEYRAYELEVVDRADCRVNQRDECPTQTVITSLPPRAYAATHGGPQRLGVLLKATWMCYGDTSDFKAVCPRPPARDPRFSPGDEVRVVLPKHITEGWQGVVEVAYYQASVSSNVYGVRFADRREVYARYFEKDLQSAQTASPQNEPPQ